MSKMSQLHSQQHGVTDQEMRSHEPFISPDRDRLVEQMNQFRFLLKKGFCLTDALNAHPISRAFQRQTLRTLVAQTIVIMLEIDLELEKEEIND